METKIRIKENVIVESRFYKAGEYVETDIPEADLSVIFKGGFGERILPSASCPETNQPAKDEDKGEDAKPPAVFLAKKEAGKKAKKS